MPFTSRAKDPQYPIDVTAYHLRRYSHRPKRISSEACFAALLESKPEQLLGQSPQAIYPQMLQDMSDNGLGLATVLTTNGFSDTSTL